VDKVTTEVISSLSPHEIGYALQPSSWNKGYATEIATHLKSFCLNPDHWGSNWIKGDCKLVVGHTEAGHTLSDKVLMKAGLQRIETKWQTHYSMLGVIKT
jgi:RimJ/RimL family protein N-acetyltransferase